VRESSPGRRAASTHGSSSLRGYSCGSPVDRPGAAERHQQRRLQVTARERREPARRRLAAGELRTPKARRPSSSTARRGRSRPPTGPPSPRRGLAQERRATRERRPHRVLAGRQGCAAVRESEWEPGRGSVPRLRTGHARHFGDQVGGLQVRVTGPGGLITDVYEIFLNADVKLLIGPPPWSSSCCC